MLKINPSLAESDKLTTAATAITIVRTQLWAGDVGFDIPVPHSLSAPRSSSDLYVGTPAGLYISRDKGETWEDTSLILQFSGVEREEISGAGYIVAYWMGHYHNFISDETAAEWWK